jgi:hypothetical protein
LTLRLVTETAAMPLGSAVNERLSREELLAVWYAALSSPVPDYEAAALAKLPPLATPVAA